MIYFTALHIYITTNNGSCATQAFSEADFQGLPEVPSALDRRLKGAAALAIRRDVEKELTAALQKKRQV